MRRRYARTLEFSDGFTLMYVFVLICLLCFVCGCAGPRTDAHGGEVTGTLVGSVSPSFASTVVYRIEDPTTGVECYVSTGTYSGGIWCREPEPPDDDCWPEER